MAIEVDSMTSGSPGQATDNIPVSRSGAPFKLTLANIATYVASVLQSSFDAKVNANGAITAATKTKVTYDAKGLVTAGADATTADIADSTNKRYVTDAQLTVIGNTSGTNTGDQTNITGNAGTVTTINGKISAGSNVTVTGSGTDASPYTISATGGGSGSPGGASGQLQYNNAGAFGGASNAKIENGNLRLDAISTPSTPAANGLNLYAESVGATLLPSALAPVGRPALLQPHLGRRFWGLLKANANSSTLNSMGLVNSITGTQTAATPDLTNIHTQSIRNEILVTTASTTAVAGFRPNASFPVSRGLSAGLGGFTYFVKWGPATGCSNTSKRSFVGLSASGSAPTDVDPSTLVQSMGFGYDSTDTNIQFMHNDGTGTCTKIDTGIPVPTSDRSEIYEGIIYCAPGSGDVSFKITRLSTGAAYSGTATTNLPTAFVGPYGYTSVGGVSAVTGLSLLSVYLETEV